MLRKAQVMEEDGKRKKETVYISVSVFEREKKRRRDGVGRQPTQVTSEFHPLSQTKKSAVTTRAGCQGDPLYLSNLRNSM